VRLHPNKQFEQNSTTAIMTMQLSVQLVLSSHFQAIKQGIVIAETLIVEMIVGALADQLLQELNMKSCTIQ